MKWSWLNPDGTVILDEVFNGPDQALAEMSKRIGDPELTMERAYRTGMRLALVKVEINVQMILQPKYVQQMMTTPKVKRTSASSRVS